MSLRIRRGTNIQRSTRNFDLAELVYTTDTKQLYVGDGITLGGVNILASSAGPGLEWNSATQKFQLGTDNLTTESILESPTGGKFFTAERAVSALADNLITNPSLHSGITFSLENGHLIASVLAITDLTTTIIDEGTNLYYTNERVDDEVANMIQKGTNTSNISITYDDVLGSLSFSVDAINTDQAVSVVANMFNGVHNFISFAFDPDTDKITATVNPDYQVVADTVGSLFSNGIHDGLSYTYDGVNHNISSTIQPSAIKYHAAQLFVDGVHDQLTVNYSEINETISLSAGPFTHVTTPELTVDIIHQSGNADFIIKGSPWGSPGTQVSFEVLSAPWAIETPSILDQVGDFRKIEIRTFHELGNTPNPIGSGEVLGTLTFTGMLNSVDDAQSHIGYQVDRNGTITSTHLPTKFFVLARPNVEADPFRMLTFDSFGRLAVNQEHASATVDINGVMRLSPLTIAPATPVEGMIAVADGVLWDPGSKSGTTSYPAYFDGSVWTAMI